MRMPHATDVLHLIKHSTVARSAPATATTPTTEANTQKHKRYKFPRGSDSFVYFWMKTTNVIPSLTHCSIGPTDMYRVPAPAHKLRLWSSSSPALPQRNAIFDVVKHAVRIYQIFHTHSPADWRWPTTKQRVEDGAASLRRYMENNYAEVKCWTGAIGLGTPAVVNLTENNILFREWKWRCGLI